MRKIRGALLPVLALFIFVCSCSCSSFRPDAFGRSDIDKNRREYMAGLMEATVKVAVTCVSRPEFAPLIIAETGKPQVTRRGWGSGVIFRSFSGKSYILTASHVIEGDPVFECKDFTIISKRGSEEKEIGKATVLINSDSETGDDVAVLEIKKNLNINLALNEDIFPGQRIVAVGFPVFYFDDSPHSVSITDGTIATLIYDAGKNIRKMRFTASVFNGNSGGGMFDSNGNIIGLVTSYTGFRIGSRLMPQDGHYYGTSAYNIVYLIRNSNFKFLLG